MCFLILCALLIFHNRPTEARYMYQYHRKFNVDHTSPTMDFEDSKHSDSSNCRHVKLNIHIGQFVINETIVDNGSQQIDSTESVDIGGQQFKSLPLGKVKYKKNANKYKLPLFKYNSEKKTTTTQLQTIKHEYEITTVVQRPLVNEIDTKQGKDSMQMINDIVKDIVKKYKFKFNPGGKPSRELMDLNQCICQYQETYPLPLYSINLDQTFTTLRPSYETGDHTTLTSEDKEKLKQVIIDKVVALLNASKGKQAKVQR